MSPFDPSRLDPKVLVEHLDGPPLARRRLAEHVLTLVDRSVFLTLRDQPHARSRKDDLVSEVIVYLYRNDARVLRQWDPSRAALKGYLNMIASRLVHRALAAERASLPLEELGPEAEAARGDLEAELAYRAGLERLVDYLHDHGSAKDLSRFRALFVDGKSPAEVARDEGASVPALHTWASRLRGMLHAALPQLVEALEAHAAQRRRGVPRRTAGRGE